MDRRDFVKRVAWGTVGGVAFGAGGTAWGQRPMVVGSPDLILTNGLVFTMDTRRSVAEAIAVRDGRVLEVGTSQEIGARSGPNTRVINLKGRSVSPGIIDAHSHLASFGKTRLYYLDLRPPHVHDFESLCDVLREGGDTGTGDWLVGHGFNEFDEGRFPRRHEIDDATGRRPTLLIHWTGQYGIANTAGLREAGLLGHPVQDPPGGRYGRYSTGPEQGELDGTLQHYTAIYSVYYPQFTPLQEHEVTSWALERFSAEGVTCVHDNFCGIETARRYVNLERAGKMPLRLRVYPYTVNLASCRQLVKNIARYEGKLVRLQGLKLAVDGYPLMYDVPQGQEQLNIPMHSPAEFQAMISMMHSEGFQVDVHAAGDLGVDMTLDAFSRAAGGDDRVPERRHRIEHFMFLNKDSIVRATSMGVPICTQPLWIELRGDDFIRRFGYEYTSTMVPVGTFRGCKALLCFGADVPASFSHRPLDSIRLAMSRRTGAGVDLDADQAIGFMEGLEAHTIGAAYAAFDEDELGSLEVGKWADLAVWNNDLGKVTRENIDELKVVATYVAGRQTYAEGSPGGADGQGE